MEALSVIGDWIADNESLLSGIAAIIVVLGVGVSAGGLILRRVREGVKEPAEAEASERITLTDLSAPAPYPVEYADSDGLRIAYARFGEGPHNLVMAPGIICHLNIMSHFPPMRDTSQALAEFCRVVSFDKRGQGLSDPCLEVPNLEERVHDIGAVMDAAGMDSAILYGISEGGPMCVKFACEYPERVKGLVLLGTTPRWLQGPDYPSGFEERLLDRVPAAWGEGTLRSLFYPSVSTERIDEETYKAFEQLIASRKSIAQLVEFMKAVDVRELLPQITCPTLVIHFAGDLAIPVRMGRAMADTIPGAEFLELPGIDHADLSSSPEGVARVRAFAESLA